MNNPLTVEELHAYLGELIQKGHGKKYCYVTTDEEGNDYRPMWFKPTSDTNEVREIMQYSCSGLSYCSVGVENVVMFG